MKSPSIELRNKIKAVTILIKSINDHMGKVTANEVLQSLENETVINETVINVITNQIKSNRVNKTKQ